MPTSRELSVQLTEDRKSADVWLAAKKLPDGSYPNANEFLEELQNRDEALAKKQAEYEQAVKVEQFQVDNAAKMGSQGRVIIPDVVGESEAKDRKLGTMGEVKAAISHGLKGIAPQLAAISQGGGKVRFEIPAAEAKTLITLTNHYPAPEWIGTTPSALYYNSVEDLFASGDTDSNFLSHFIQTTDTDNSAMTAEGVAVTDSAFAWTYTTDEVETVEDWVPVTREFLNDNAGMQSEVQSLLTDRLAKTVSKQLMYGTGTTPELWGVTVRTNFASQAKGTDPTFDQILKAIDKVSVAGDATPDAVVLHPTDWMGLVLTRTIDGVYILGNPGNMPAAPSIWGLPVRVSSTVAAAAGTGCVGAFRTMAKIFNNGGITVEVSTEHSTYATERKVAIIAYRRLGVINRRPTAFVKMTGIAA